MTKIHNKEQLVAAAEKVFLDKGYAAARVEDIGAELGVLQGSLYYHIGSKAGLLRLVLRHRFLLMVDRIETIGKMDGTAREKLREAIIAQLSYHSEKLPDSPQWFSNPGGPKESKQDVENDRKMVLRFRRAWRELVAVGIESGEIRSTIDPEDVALAILGASNSVARWHEGSSLTHADIADSQIELFWSGISGTQTP